MNNPLSLVYPAINVIVTALFAGMVLRQYIRKRRLYQLYWSIALTMAFVATLAYVCMILVQPTSDAGVLLFRLYYYLGAALMPCWLGLGSIALITKPKVAQRYCSTLIFLSVVAFIFIASAGINMQQLGKIAGTPGAGILQPQVAPWLFAIIILNTLGVLAVVGVAVYSGWKLFVHQGSGNLLWGNILILGGDLINAAAGSSARLGIENIFWLVMTVGWIVFFAGVVFASRPQHHAARASSQPTTPEKVETASGS